MKKFADYIKGHEEAARSLLQSNDYRAFLKTFFTIKKTLNPTYSFAVFANKAKLSKSLPRDIIEGEKRITEKTLPNFVAAMELDGLLQEYFVQLVQLEKDPTRIKLVEQLANLYLETYFIKTYTDSNFQDYRSPFLYAASGEVGTGAKLELMAKRTGLSLQEIKEAMPNLEKLKLGKYVSEHDTFIPFTPQVHIDVSEKGPSHFMDFYKYCLNLQKDVVQKKFQHPETFFYNEVFSINEKDLSTLKVELRNVLKSFLLKAENSQGDSVAVLNLGLFKQTFQAEH